MVFGKRKKKDVVDGVTGHSGVVVGSSVVSDAAKNVSGSQSVVEPVLSPEDSLLLDQIRSYRSSYGKFVSGNDVANLGDPLLRAEELNLKWAIFQELRRLNEQMKDALDDGD